MRNYYLTDGTLENFYTAVFDAYKDGNACLSSAPSLQIGLGDGFFRVQTDESKAARVMTKIRGLDGRALWEIDRILRANAPDKEQAAYLYLRVLIESGKPARGNLANPSVRRAMDICAQVGTEVHRLKGFLRFQETADGVLYAPCSPDNDVVDLLMPHFAARLKTCSFIIHDVWRGVAGIYHKGEWLVTAAGEAVFSPSERERNFQSLWKKYYHTVTIAQRKNERQRRNYMPVRYWKFLTEEPN